MKKNLLLLGLPLLLPVVSPHVVLAQEREDVFQNERMDFDTLTNDDRIGSFVEGLIDEIESGVDQMTRRDRNYDSDRDTAAASHKYTAGSAAVTFTGNTSIDANDRIDGNVVVKGGTLTVTGVVQGDALAINGDIVVKDGGRITGNARAINGKVKRESGGTVEGYVEESSSVRDAIYERHGYTHGRPYRFNELWLDESLFPDNFLFRYNRVEGLFLGLGSQKKFYWDGSKVFSGYGSAGYAFKIHRWRLNLGLDRQFATDDALYELGTEGHSITDTKDEWLMKLSENNITALLWHEDYRDYYTREGFSVHAARYTKDSDLSTQLRVDYLIDNYTSLTKTTDWSIFRPSHEFRDNPAVQEGTMHSVLGTAGLSTLERFGRRTVGWNAFASVERGGSVLGGGFDFTRVIVDVRRFQPLSDYDKVDVRVRVGSLQGDDVPQKSFEIGGANTLPAYAFKQFAGNRMVLGNFEYILSGKLMDDVFLWPNGLNFIVLADAGEADSVSTKKALANGFPTVNSNQIKSDVGFAIGWHDESWRLGFAWRTDERSPVSVFLRLNKPF